MEPGLHPRQLRADAASAEWLHVPHALNVLDDYNRQVLRIEADTCLPARRIIRVLEQLEERRGLPSMLGVDNGPEFISQRLDTWCKDQKITLALGDVTSTTNPVNRRKTRMSNA